MKIKKDAWLLSLGCLATLPFTSTAAIAATEVQANGEGTETRPALIAEANTTAPSLSLSTTLPALESVGTSVAAPTDIPTADLQVSLTDPVLAQMQLPEAAPTALPEAIVPVQPQAQPVAVPAPRSNRAKDLTAQGAPAPRRADDLFMPPQLFNLDTANQLGRGDNMINVGFRWYFPAGAIRDLNGRGQQVVFGGFSSGLTDKIQLDLGGFYIGDFLTEKVSGLPIGSPSDTPFAAFGGGYVQAKYQVIRGERLRLSVAGSFELLATASSFPLFTNNPGQSRRTFKWSPVGAIQLPISYTITRGLQAHFTPTLAILPEELRGGDFYGTSFILGGGLSWQPIRLVGFFADVNYPVGPGGNTVRSDDGDIVRRPVWSGGVRFNLPEFNKINVSLDLYATNAMGITPATRALSQLPNSDQVSFSSNLTFRF
jgi:hypothetical protein